MPRWLILLIAALVILAIAEIRIPGPAAP